MLADGFVEFGESVRVENPPLLADRGISGALFTCFPETKKMTPKTLLTACAAALCVAFMAAGNASAAETMTLKGAHKAMNLPCEACHGNIKPREIPEETACMTCHQSREAVKAKTAKLKPNPHYGHDETVECTACHKEHQQSVLLCDECHQWGYKTP